MEDEELNEKFRALTMQLENIERECGDLHIRLDGIDVDIKNLKDELTLPSGKVTQQFSKLEKQIHHLGAKLSS